VSFVLSRISCEQHDSLQELLIESGIIDERLLKDLLDEANEIVAITVFSIKSARTRASRSRT
jgi:hypothetical protein